MLPTVFFSQNLHFAIHLFAALVCFAVFWLYFDAWLSHERKKGVFLWLGFLLLCISFLIHATNIEQSVLGVSLLGNFTDSLSTGARLFGYILIIIGQIKDPLQAVPDTEGLKLEKTSAVATTGIIGNTLLVLLPVGSFVCGLLYWRRTTTGLERHLRRVALAFFGLSLFEVLSLSKFLQGSDNPFLYSLSASFGLIWYLEHIVLVVSVILLGLWVWQYLITRLQSQLFMIFTSAVLAIFLLTTVSFTFLLLNSIQNESLNNLATATNVLNYALNSKKDETLSTTESLATNPNIVKELSAKDHKALNNLDQKLLETKAKSSILITDENGQVLSRAEEPDRWGDSMSDDPLIRRALVGLEGTSVVTQDSVVAPLIYIKSSVPVRDATNNIIGSLTIGVLLDNAFVDGLKNTTGLDSAIYAGNTRAATTFLAADEKSRWIGVKEENSDIKNQVLQKGNTFTGSVSVLNKPFMGAYSPLRDVNNEVVGMIFIGKSQSSILLTAGKSIELTFLVAAVLISLSMIPSYFVSRYLSKQLS